MTILPTKRLLDGGVEVHEGRFGVNEKTPPDAWLDFQQRYLKIEVLGHVNPRMEIRFDHVRLKKFVPWK